MSGSARWCLERSKRHENIRRRTRAHTHILTHSPSPNEARLRVCVCVSLPSAIHTHTRALAHIVLNANLSCSMLCGMRRLWSGAVE